MFYVCVLCFSLTGSVTVSLAAEEGHAANARPTTGATPTRDVNVSHTALRLC